MRKNKVSAARWLVLNLSAASYDYTDKQKGRESMGGLCDILTYLPPRLREAAGRLSPFAVTELQELRLRTCRPLSAVMRGKESFITPRGGVTSTAELGLTVSADEMEQCFKAVCDYSVHSFTRELSEGFITLRGGHRVGLCATAVYRDGQFSGIHNIGSMNFRIACQRIGCADGLFGALFSDGLKSVLLAGPPLSAKTTVLRDLCRLLGMRWRLSLIDHRGELAAVCAGIPHNDVGVMTDVLDGYPKAYGIQTAVKVMSPQAVVCDEIGAQDEAREILDCLNSGVKFIATVHAGERSELFARAGIKALLEAGVFDLIVFLGSGKNIGRIMEIGKAGALYAEACGRGIADLRVGNGGDVYIGSAGRENCAAV